jgi:uncharacterized Zn-finger protein
MKSKYAIQCKYCHRLFPAALQFDRPEAFFTSTLVGNWAVCPYCHKRTGMDKTNMVYAADKEGFVGAETMPEEKK